ncbi:MAG TPA: serine/threonine-protein kinase [Opitutaceae bacterium]|nr:serine/threonine-protein kinase [Opitutaceae bacterium]
MKLAREEELFEAARRIAGGGKRRAYLQEACGGDEGLRRRLEALLAAGDEADAFFAEGSQAVAGTLASLQSARGLAGAAAAVSAHLPGEEPIGTWIGRYQLLRKMGEGGCGVVYEAEQSEPIRRRVALKIIKLGMETKSVIARFEAERQALAMMDHPNIAHVFDAGATRRGPPYFVMELVRGVKITDYCDQHQLGVPQRLDLFVQICHAIQHAHQKGIVHGDIKPSNIMVTLHDGVAVPKVIDFGISKAMEARLSEKLMVTADGQLIGTPAYMSPEQGEMGAVDIDTRSDIYSLGVLLYELLAGRTPFDPKELVAQGLDAMRRTLRETDPPRPSIRLRGLPPAEAQATAAARRTDPARLAALLRGDLDWIAMKALEKDRRRRYETANGLAMDILRHLAHEPVSARPPSRLYRFRKLVRRNRGVFAATGAVALALVAGLGTSTWLFLQEREAERQETRLLHEAETRQKITQAALLVSQEHFAPADALMAHASFAQPNVEGAAVFRSLGEWHATESRWKLAAERLDEVLRLDALDGWDVSSLDHLRQGAVLAEGGDQEGYERFRRAALQRYADAGGQAADRILKICLLLPADPALLARLRPYADANAAALARADASGDLFMAAWRAMSQALWEYRQGNYTQAIAWAQRCLNYRESNAPRAATALVVRAMAERRLGRRAEAEADLAGARGPIEAKFRGPIERGTPVQGFWFDWLFARVLLREAVRGQ